MSDVKFSHMRCSNRNWFIATGSSLGLLIAAAFACDTSKPDSASRSGSARPSPVAMSSRESSVVAPASEPVIAVPIDTASVADSSAEGTSAELEEWIRQRVGGVGPSATPAARRVHERRVVIDHLADPTSLVRDARSWRHAYRNPLVELLTPEDPEHLLARRGARRPVLGDRRE